MSIHNAIYAAMYEDRPLEVEAALQRIDSAEIKIGSNYDPSRNAVWHNDIGAGGIASAQLKKRASECSAEMKKMLEAAIECMETENFSPPPLIFLSDYAERNYVAIPMSDTTPQPMAFSREPRTYPYDAAFDRIRA